jgi:cytosine/uracil/thiamine/allantoin permease
MVRSLVGFAAFAVVAMIVLKILGSVFGIVLSLIGTIIYFAFWGFIIYLVLRVFSPGTADKVKETISGKPSA